MFSEWHYLWIITITYLRLNFELSFLFVVNLTSMTANRPTQLPCRGKRRTPATSEIGKSTKAGMQRPKARIKINTKIMPTVRSYSPEPNFATAVAGEMQGMCGLGFHADYKAVGFLRHVIGVSYVSEERTAFVFRVTDSGSWGC
jgi:hypothetical protein